MEDMNVISSKTIGFFIVLLALASACMIGVRAQQNPNQSSVSNLATNWVGYLTVGKNDVIDRIAPGPSPSVVEHVELGLRSDGVVVWRQAQGAK